MQEILEADSGYGPFHGTEYSGIYPAEWSDAVSWGVLQLLPNLLFVPLGEEMIFRGILFGALLHLLDELEIEFF